MLIHRKELQCTVPYECVAALVWRCCWLLGTHWPIAAYCVPARVLSTVRPPVRHCTRKKEHKELQAIGGDYSYRARCFCWCVLSLGTSDAAHQLLTCAVLAPPSTANYRNRAFVHRICSFCTEGNVALQYAAMPAFAGSSSIISVVSQERIGSGRGGPIPAAVDRWRANCISLVCLMMVELLTHHRQYHFAQVEVTPPPSPPPPPLSS